MKKACTLLNLGSPTKQLIPLDSLFECVNLLHVKYLYQADWKPHECFSGSDGMAYQLVNHAISYEENNHARGGNSAEKEK